MPSFDLLQKSTIEPALENQLRDIYELSFPLDERCELRLMLAAVEKGEKQLYLAQEEEKLLGFAFTQPIASQSIAFLEYLAVTPRMRSQGIGGMLFDFILKTLRAQKAKPILLFEVESPHSDDPAEQDLRQRRIGFYQRHGAELVQDNGAYRMPNLAHPESTASLPMRLMWVANPPGAPFPFAQRLDELFTLIFKEIYGRPQQDSLLQEMLLQLTRK